MALNKLKTDFFAASSRRSRLSKRNEVSKVAVALTKGRAFMPLTLELVEGVAASLKEAGLRSANQYLAELRLMRVEAGYDLTDQMKRAFDLCRRAMDRSKGPVKRAAEVRLHELEDKIMMTMGNKAGWPERPGLAFVWACLWMLREIELRNMMTSHVRIHDKLKTVTIWLPISKCDQAGAGVKRTLGCCGKRKCSCMCPWRVACKVMKAARKMGVTGTLPLFAGRKLKATAKAGFVESWRHLFGDDVSGHSPRRSGAMYYVRNNLPIQELAFLGRWRSNIVLQYAEEALQEKPVVLKPSKVETKVLGSEVMEDHPQDHCAIADIPKEQSMPSIAEAFSSPKDLWVVTKGRGSKMRPAHRVTKACWSLPIKEWSTACGWLFAEKSAEASFLHKLKPDQLMCSKCCAGSDATSQRGSVMTSDPGQLQDATKAQPGKTDQKITTRKRSTSGGWVGSVKSLKLS